MIPDQEPEDIKVPEDAFPIISCLPADPKEWDKAGFVHIDVPESYKKGKCEKCDAEVYIGPKQRTFIELHPETQIQCMPCTMKLVIASGKFGLAALNSKESCTFFTKKGRIIGKRNPNN